MLVTVPKLLTLPGNTYECKNNECIIYKTIDTHLAAVVTLYSGYVMLCTCVTITNIVIHHRRNKPQICSKYNTNIVKDYSRITLDIHM